MAATTVPAQDRRRVSRPSVTRALRRGVRDPLAWLVLFFLLVIALAPVLATHDPVSPDIAERLSPPSSEHFFGTDRYGMDVYSRVIYATRVNFAASITSILLAVAVGLPLGILAGYVGRWVDDVLNRLVEVLQALPQFLFALAALAVVGPSVRNMIVVIGLLNVAGYLKLARTIIVSTRTSDYVSAARCAGLSDMQIMRRHLLPAIVAPFFGLFAITCAYAIQIIAGLSFLGLGVTVPQPEWGSMINIGAPYMVQGQWWMATFPGLAIFLAVLMLRMLTERLRRRFALEQ